MKRKNRVKKYIKSRRPSFIEGVAGGRRKNISLCEPRRIRELFTLPLPLEPRCGLCVVCFRSLPHFTSLKFTCCAVYFRLNKMPSVVDNGFIADFLTRLVSTLLVIMFDFSSNSQRACSARAFLFLRESAVPDRRWVRRVRPLMANRELSRQGSQHSPNDGDPCEGAVMRCRRSRVGVANPDSITTIVGA